MLLTSKLVVGSSSFFLNLGLSQPHFGFFLGLLFIDNFFVNSDRKQERSRKSMHRSIPHSFRKSPAPSENRFAAILN